MATIGRQLDASRKNADRMGAYFLRMERWSNWNALESRLRFMLKVSSLSFIQMGSSAHEQGWTFLNHVLGESRRMPWLLALDVALLKFSSSRSLLAAALE